MVLPYRLPFGCGKARGNATKSKESKIFEEFRDKGMRALWLLLAIGLLWAGPARAGYPEAIELIDRGEYQAAYQELLPLAEAGDANAQYHLAFMYDYGQGVARDPATAAAWYRKAAVQDLAVAQFTLADMYETGKGVERDLIEAYRWYDRAVGNLAPSEIRDSLAARRDGIAEQLSETELARARDPKAEPTPPQAPAEAKPPEPEETEPAPRLLVDAPNSGDGAPAPARTAAAEAPVPVRTAPEPPRRAVPQDPPDRGDQATAAGVELDLAETPAPEPPQVARAPHEPSEPSEPSKPYQVPTPEELQQLQPGWDGLVSRIQGHLAAMGYDPGPVDGMAGDQTIAAIEFFEEARGLEPSGEVTEALLEELAAAQEAGHRSAAAAAVPGQLDPFAEETIELLAEWQRRLEVIVSHVTIPGAAIHGWAKVDLWASDLRRLLAARLGQPAVARFDALGRDAVLGDPYGNFQRVTGAYLEYLIELQEGIARDPSQLARR